MKAKDFGLKKGERVKVRVTNCGVMGNFPIGTEGELLAEIFAGELAYYFLQNIKGGSLPPDNNTHPFKYSWVLTKLNDYGVEFKKVEETFMVGDWVVITKSDKNWVLGMDKFVGKTVQVKSTLTHGDIRFDEDGGWNWIYRDGHFRRALPREIPGYNHGLIFYPIVSGAAVQMFNNTFIDTKQKFYGGVDPIEPIFRFVLGDVVDSVEREGAREQASSCLEIKDGGLRVCGSSVKSGLKITNRKQVNGVNWYEVLKPGATTPYNNWFNEIALERTIEGCYNPPSSITIKPRQSGDSYKTQGNERDGIGVDPFWRNPPSMLPLFKNQINIDTRNPYYQTPVKVTRKRTKFKLKTIKTS